MPNYLRSGHDGETIAFVTVSYKLLEKGKLDVTIREKALEEESMAEELTGQPPKFGGSTGGLLKKAEIEEKYAITWNSAKEQVFEMPTGGAAIMNEGDNLLYLARKEQCLALGTQLRTKFKPKIENFKIYRVFPDGSNEYLHPKDGVFPEKVNEGRPYEGKIERNIGSNPDPAKVKFTGKATYEV